MDIVDNYPGCNTACLIEPSCGVHDLAATVGLGSSIVDCCFGLKGSLDIVAHNSAADLDKNPYLCCKIVSRVAVVFGKDTVDTVVCYNNRKIVNAVDAGNLYLLLNDNLAYKKIDLYSSPFDLEPDALIGCNSEGDSLVVGLDNMHFDSA